MFLLSTAYYIICRPTCISWATQQEAAYNTDMGSSLKWVLHPFLIFLGAFFIWIVKSLNYVSFWSSGMQKVRKSVLGGERSDLYLGNAKIVTALPGQQHCWKSAVCSKLLKYTIGPLTCYKYVALWSWMKYHQPGHTPIDPTLFIFIILRGVWDWWPTNPLWGEVWNKKYIKL